MLFGVVTLVFLIFSINPGDPARMLLDQRANEETVQAVREELGLDLPLWQQYLLFLNDVSPLSVHDHEDEESRVYFSPEKYNGVELVPLGSEYSLTLKVPYLRKSYQSRRPVTELIADALPATVLLAVTAIVIALIIGIAVGIISALNRNSFFDQASMVGAVLGMSAPSFFSAIVIAWIGGYLWHSQTNLPALPIYVGLVFLLVALFAKLSGIKRKEINWRGLTAVFFKGILGGIALWLLLLAVFGLTGGQMPGWLNPYISLPGTGLDMTGSMYAIDVFEGPYFAPQNLILPAITLGVRPLAVVIQLSRSAFLDVWSQDYIRTARAKGLSTWKVVTGHALKNALNPVITAVSGWFASMLAGAVFVEYVFNWRGLGLEVFQALEKEDFPVVMGAVLVIAFTFVIINIAVDIIYGLLDPRVRIK